MGKIFGFVGALCILSVSAFARDPIYFRELEQQAKSAQARSYQRHLAVRDIEDEPAPVTVDAYRFDLTVLPADGKIEGTLTADLVATAELSEVGLDAIGLTVSKAWFTDASGARSETRFETAASAVKVSLPVAQAPGSRFSVTLAYSAKGDKRTEVGSDNEHGLFFVNADGAHADQTPTIYTSTEPQLARTWFPCIDDPSLKAARTIMRVTVPAGWIAVSNGALKGRVAHPESKTETFEWEERFPIPTYLVSLSIAPFTVIEDHWTPAAGGGSVPVQYFVPKALEDKARFDFARTPQMIEYFSTLWLPYPYEKYSMSAVPLFTGAMEHTTATTISDDEVSGDRTSEETFAHELSHHWWGDLVTPGTWDDLWLNEAFATYSEYLFATKFEGSNDPINDMIGNRERYFEFDPAATAAVVDPKVEPAEKFTPAVYEKGGWVLHMLHHQLGDEAFFGAMRAYLREHAFRTVSTADLKQAFEQASGKDLTVFFNQWVTGPGYPQLTAAWSFDAGSRTVQLKVDQAGAVVFRLPLEVLVAARDAAGATVTSLLKVELTEKSQVFALPLPAGFPAPAGVELDPEMKLLKKLTAARQPGELRFWLDANMSAAAAPWLARFSVLGELDHASLGAETVRELVARVSAENAAAVRAAMLEVLEAARPAKDLGDPEVKAVQAVVVRLLTDPEIVVRMAAANAAAAYLSPALSDAVADAFARETSVRAKARQALALGHSKNARAFELLYGELQKTKVIASDRRLVNALLQAFGALGDKRAAAVLTDFVNGPNPYYQTSALESLGSLQLPETFSFIAGLLRDETRAPDLRIAAAEGLANYGGVAAAKELNDELAVEKNEAVKKGIKAALARLGGMPKLRELSVTGSPALLRW